MTTLDHEVRVRTDDEEVRASPSEVPDVQLYELLAPAPHIRPGRRGPARAFRPRASGLVPAEATGDAGRTDRTAVEAELPHACDPHPAAAPVDDSARAARWRSPRIVGIDAARGIALLGMMAVHILSAETASGDMSLAWVLAAGKSAALFAVLAGVAIALTSGRQTPPEGRTRTAIAASLAVRALLVGCLGLLLGSVVPYDSAGVILAYYAVLFVLAIPLLGLSVRTLVVLTGLAAVLVPVLSHVARGELAEPELTNPTFLELWQQPVQLLTELSLTGLYPALPWVAYLCIGLAIGRSRLSARATALGLMLFGVLVALVSSAVSWLLMERAGGRERLADVAIQTMSLDDFTNVLVRGTEGTLPTTSPWWLAVQAPHTTTPFDLLFTIGVATAVIGFMIVLGWVAGSAIRPLAALGSMPLTLYIVHLLLLASPFAPASDGVAFALQVVVLTAFALVWSRRFDRGPLEHVLWAVTSRVRRAVAREPVPTPAVPDDQPPPSPYQPAPVTQQAPRNGLAVAALILEIIGALTGLISVLFTGANSVLLWVAGILAVIALVLGFVGFGRAQRGEATNATMALWGIITGVIAMVLLVVGLLIQILTGVFADSSEEPSVQTETTAAPTAETSTPTEPEASAPTEAENIYLHDLEVGDCLAKSPVAEIFSVGTVPCSEPHSHEVFASVNLPEGDGEFPGYQVIDAQAEELCIAQFEGFIGLPSEQSELETWFMTPSEETWLARSRVVSCAVYDPAGEVNGSFRDAER
jgi:uncharacterized membrane protein YeiB